MPCKHDGYFMNGLGKEAAMQKNNNQKGNPKNSEEKMSEDSSHQQIHQF